MGCNVSRGTYFLGGQRYVKVKFDEEDLSGKVTI